MTITNRIFEQLPFSIGSAAKRQAIVRDITRALPDVEASQARIAELEAALQNIKREYDPSECGLNAQIMFEIASAALKAKP